MSIYAEKRNGRPTGFWKIEVTVAGSRHVNRTRSYEDALRIESELLILGSVPSRETSVYRLADLDADASMKLWAGQKDGDYALKRWRSCLALLGPSTPVAEVRYAAMERLTEALRAQKKYSNKTVNRYLMTVSKALRWAWQQEKIQSMPPVPRLDEGEGRTTYLRLTEIPEFLSWLRANERPTTALCLEILLITGMRAGEFLSITPDNIEFDSDNECTIRLSADKTKTGHSRSVPLPGGLGKRLADLAASGMPDYDLLLRACHRACAGVGTKDDIGLHGLRHTAATIMTAKKIPSLTVAKLLGHRNLATTQRYAHATDDALRDATRIMELSGRPHGNEVKTMPQTLVKSVKRKKINCLQSAPFAARDIPPEGEDP